jgi:hypothetical protein
VINILLRTATVALACGALLGSLAVPAAADRDYRTQRYDVTDPAGAVVGFVVNTHAEGPVNYGIERYHLKKAEAGTYQVALQVHGDPACTVPVLPPFLTTTLRTNVAGNAHGGAVFSAADVAQIVFEPVTVWGIWTFTRGDGLTYSTDCVPVTLDVP